MTMNVISGSSVLGLHDTSPVLGNESRSVNLFKRSASVMPVSGTGAVVPFAAFGSFSTFASGALGCWLKVFPHLDIVCAPTLAQVANRPNVINTFLIGPCYRIFTNGKHA